MRSLTGAAARDTFRRMDIGALRGKFHSTFSRDAAGIARAPGRVNLIGEHTDYNGGFVLPIAVCKETLAALAPRDDRTVNLVSLQGGGEARVNLDAAIAPGAPTWANYCRGVLAGLKERGVALRGCDILFSTDVPIGGGLSSSASLEVATAIAVLAAAGSTDAVSQGDLALICQQSEHEFAGAPCGIMDQSIVIMGRAGQALLLDCRDLTSRHVPFDDPAAVLLVADTQVKHDIADGGYAARQEQCYAAAASLGVQTLREADKNAISQAELSGKLASKELMRARHVVSEIARTLSAVEALESGDMARFGKLMYESHRSLKDDYEVSCDELDVVVESAGRCEGVYGARMTGGGFGGCAIILAASDKAACVTQAVQSDFENKFGRVCPIFATTAADGAGLCQ